jgi:hypothetical protein
LASKGSQKRASTAASSQFAGGQFPDVGHFDQVLGWRKQNKARIFETIQKGNTTSAPLCAALLKPKGPAPN